MRIGLGYDVHPLVSGRSLILGGIEIPFELGLLGHSDADVLTHAACDALLGAAGLGDIGQHFPDHRSEYKDIYSIELLKASYAVVSREGFDLINLDAVVVAQAPKLSPYRLAMQERMAEALNCQVNQVNIKATTSEGLGFAGEGKGIAAKCIVLIE
jgi:2-C-methyl-D-erythritol 2,4-cyclodiphosphate synthase